MSKNNTSTATKLREQLDSQFPKLSFSVEKELAPSSYFKLGGNASIYVESDDHPEIAKLFSYCRTNQIPFTTLGGASNVVISDAGISGVVLRITDRHFTAEKKDDGIHIAAGAGLQTALLVRKSVDAGGTGLEYFLGVPGTVGGAIYNNAHYLEDLIGEYVISVTAATAEGELVTYKSKDLDFAYERSRFQTHDEIILQAQFLIPQDTENISQSRITEAAQYRARTQPLGVPSSGCIFQNVSNTAELRKRFPQFAERDHVPAGFLIDQAGMKGEREGEIEISDKHAAFFINTGEGTSSEVRRLVRRVKDRVAEKFGVTLHEEVFYLGSDREEE